MFNRKEILLIIITVFVLAISLSFLKGLEAFIYILLPVFLVLIINIFAKKISSFYLDSKIELDLWGIRRYGFKPSHHLKRSFPAGILFPLLFSVFTFGNVVWLAPLIFEAKPRVYRAAKRHGLYKFSEMTEEHLGLIAAIGIMANILFAVAGYFAGFIDFSRLNIYFAFFNLIPISNLDGNKIFFGNIVLWSFLATVILIGLGASFFLI